MQYVLFIYADEGGWAHLTDAEQEQALAGYMAYNAALTKAGVLKASNRLEPSSSATPVRAKNGKSHVQDGPYADSKEQLGGFYVIDVTDLDAAISWAARCPAASYGIVEVRPMWCPPS